MSHVQPGRTAKVIRKEAVAERKALRAIRELAVEAAAEEEADNDRV